MIFNFYTLEQAIDKLAQATNSTCSIGNIADLVHANKLELNFHFEGFIGSINHLEPTIEDSNIINLRSFSGYLRPYDQELYNLINGDIEYLELPLAISKLNFEYLALFSNNLDGTNLADISDQLPMSIQATKNFSAELSTIKLTRNKLRVPAESLNGFLSNPSQDESETVEIRSQQAIAIMALLLADAKACYKSGSKPNAKLIGENIAKTAKTFFPSERGFKAFNKKISDALKTFEDEIPSAIRNNLNSQN
ncbi:hypothetical protein [Acinetobacter johnsonii]|uniref:Leucine-rich repeat domain-containing protein n=1 Tax=Acinetobacter johnsonii TaxID=40214 RepID=A0AAV3WA55_ACIJO|nr:hypothetical protein [Acinetobacter johnsonii]WQE01654.1 hypothetical protein U0040_01190 [Acinetobacter johnsonii]GEK42817.1 hypothetical protein AJO04nite_00750 [Acinetobacter johnsonii]